MLHIRSWGSAVLVVAFLFLSSVQGGCGEDIPSEDGMAIEITLRLISGEELHGLLGSKVTSSLKDFYILGQVVNRMDRSAFVKFEIRSSNNPTVHIDNIELGWIPPNRATAVYFLRYIMEPPLKTSPEEVKLESKIHSINYK